MGKRYFDPCIIFYTEGHFIMTTIQDIADKMGISKSAVSKALNNAPDISENLRKQVLETAVALGYTKLRRYRNSVRKICVLIEKDNIQYEEPYHFAYDIIMGFRQLAEPQGFDVVIEPVDIPDTIATSLMMFICWNMIMWGLL